MKNETPYSLVDLTDTKSLSPLNKHKVCQLGLGPRHRADRYPTVRRAYRSLKEMCFVSALLKAEIINWTPYGLKDLTDTEYLSPQDPNLELGRRHSLTQRKTARV